MTGYDYIGCRLGPAAKWRATGIGKIVVRAFDRKIDVDRPVLPTGTGDGQTRGYDIGFPGSASNDPGIAASAPETGQAHVGTQHGQGQSRIFLDPAHGLIEAIGVLAFDKNRDGANHQNAADQQGDHQFDQAHAWLSAKNAHPLLHICTVN